MKKLFSLFSALIVGFFVLLNFSTRTTASATQTGFMRVIDQTTPFFSSISDSKPLFYLPYTYYVKILDNDNGFFHVECFLSPSLPSIDGYVPEDALFDDGLIVSSPYVNLDIKTVSTAILFEDSSLITPLQYVFPERHMRYYGALPTDKGILYYVEYNDKLGYVRESDVYPFVIANHSNPLTFIPVDAPESENTTPEQSPNNNEHFGLKIVIIGCLVFAGLIALFVSIKQRPKKGVAIGYYDDNDYE